MQLVQWLVKVDDVHTTEQTIDISSLPAGSYILNAQTAEGILSEKFNIVK